MQALFIRILKVGSFNELLLEKFIYLRPNWTSNLQFDHSYEPKYRR